MIMLGDSPDNPGDSESEVVTTTNSEQGILKCDGSTEKVGFQVLENDRK